MRQTSVESGRPRAVIRELAPKVETVAVEMMRRHRRWRAASRQAQHCHSKLDLSPSGAGIGAGIMVHGRILSGTTHAAGEVGHMTVVDGGEQCQCGNKGCWELYVSERAPVRWFAAAKQAVPGTHPPQTISDVVDAARAGDDDALCALRLWGQHIGSGLGI